MQKRCNDGSQIPSANRHNRGVNSTETPGGSGIPAGWYDDPSGQGLRWWDGEQWTEHVHTAESAAAAVDEAGEGDREAPPPQLAKLRQSIQAKGAKGVGMVLGGLVLVIVVVALLLSGGSDDNSGKAAQPGGATPTTGQSAALQQQIKALRRHLKNKSLPTAQKKSLEKELKHLEKQAGGSSKGSKSGKNAKSKKKDGGTSADEATPSTSDEGR
jgi:hypothetical protein